LLAIDYILKKFEQCKERYKGDKTLALMFNSRWAKIKKYYALTNESLAYIIALILNPNSK